MTKKIVIFWCISAFVGLYTTFVLQSLWNWYVTEAFHLPQISFWVMYGIVLVIGMFADRESKRFAEQQQFAVLANAIDACIPDEKRALVKEQHAEQEKQMWGEVGIGIFRKAIGNTFTLVVGWIVHSFLT